jgi:hypothetical protein
MKTTVCTNMLVTLGTPLEEKKKQHINLLLHIGPESFVFWSSMLYMYVQLEEHPNESDPLCNLGRQGGGGLFDMPFYLFL